MCILHTQPDPSKSGDDSIWLTRTVLRVVFITKDPDHLSWRLLRLEVQEQILAVFAMDILEIFGSMK